MVVVSSDEGRYPPDGRTNTRLTGLWRLGPSEVIALVGAGGKSSLMEALARDYEAEGARVVLTTTTKIRPPTERPFVAVTSAETLARASVGGLRRTGRSAR